MRKNVQLKTYLVLIIIICSSLAEHPNLEYILFKGTATEISSDPSTLNSLSDQ